mmetsp:Transcript_6867/g.9680  ORF Transcript_6867/g.9680 Transcript_6867/m.9680 type:complete len:547 (+) Transcript_6867:249-1889(+)
MKFSISSIPFILASTCLLQKQTAIVADDAVGCFSSLSDIWNIERPLENDETGEIRKYYICPGIHIIGFPGPGGFTNGDFPLLLRPNVQYICSHDDYEGNDCVLKGGLIHVLGFFNAIGKFEYLENVLLKGLTFDACEAQTITIDNPGKIKFENCNFQNNANRAPIFLNWRPEIAFGVGGQTRSNTVPYEDYGFPFFGTEGGRRNEELPRKLQERHIEVDQILDVEFDSLTFRDNKEFLFNQDQRTLHLAGMILIRGSTVSNQAWPAITAHVTIKDSLFQDNEYVSHPDSTSNKLSYIIAVDNDSTSLNLVNNCFIDSSAPGGIAPIISSSSANVVASNNSGTPISDTKCQFIAIIEEVAGVDGAHVVVSPRTFDYDYECVDYDADFCSERPSQAPSVSAMPSESPSLSMVPTLSTMPSSAPSFSPTVQPSLSQVPTFTPTSSPSMMPTVSVKPSSSPSTVPSVPPTTTIEPSMEPSVSLNPTLEPSASPSSSTSPSSAPTASPSFFPSTLPTMSPTESPTPSASMKVVSHVLSLVVSVGITAALWM